MKIKINVAAVVEIDGDGDAFPCIYAATSPEKLLPQVVRHLETEKNERKLDITYDEDKLLDELHGNILSGPMRIPVRDWDTEFLISSETITVDSEDIYQDNNIED